LSSLSNFLNFGFHSLDPPVEFLFGALVGVALLLLEQADDLVGLTD